MTLDLRAIREELAILAGEALGWRAHDVLPENGDLPLVAVGFPSWTAQTLGLAEVTVDLTVVADGVDGEAVQAALDVALGTGDGGLPGALHDATGDAWAGGIRVLGVGDYRVVTVGELEGLAADVSIALLARR